MGRLLILNLGTFAETHRFKSAARDRGYLDEDAFDAASAGGLVTDGGVQKRRDFGSELYSFYEFSPDVWNSKFNGGTYKDAFTAWCEAALQKPVHCVYLTGHHWGGTDCYLSWTHSASDFNARFSTGHQVLNFGMTGNYIDLDTKMLRSEIQLIVGFGCDVATKSISAKYRTFFDSRPVILAWDATIRVPKRHEASVNEAFFDHLDAYATANGGPAADRLDWFYKNNSMELVRAWGQATRTWFSSQARARDKDGKFYKFVRNKKTGTMDPVKA